MKLKVVFNGKVGASKYLYKVLKKEFNDLNKNPKYLDLVKQLEPCIMIKIHIYTYGFLYIYNIIYATYDY